MDFHKSSSVSRKCKNRNEVIISLKNSLLASQKLEYFSKKSSEFFREPPQSRNIRVKYLAHLGSSTPTVKYTDTSSPSFSFSSLSRFENSIFEKFKSIAYTDRFPVVHKLSSEEKIRQSQRFSINKDMRQYSPENKLKKLEDLRKSYEFSKNIVQLTKSNIFENKKMNRESKLKLKFKKLEIRLNKGLLGDVKASWVILTTAFCCAQLIKEQLIVKKYLISKIKYCWTKIRTFFYAFNQFLYLLKQFRKRVKVLQICKSASRYLKILSIKKRVNKNFIAEFIEYSLSRGALKGLIVTFFKKIKFIQSTMRLFLDFRNKVCSNLLALWKSTESQISLKNVKTKKKKKSLKLINNFLTTNSKILFIRSFIKSKVREHVKSLQFYNQSFLPKSQKPAPLDMLGSTFLSQASIHIESAIMPKRSSIKKSPSKKIIKS